MISIIQEAVKDRSAKPTEAATPKQRKQVIAGKRQHYPTAALFFVLGSVIWAVAYSVLFNEGLFVKELATGGALLFFSLLFRQLEGRTL